MHRQYAWWSMVVWQLARCGCLQASQCIWWLPGRILAAVQVKKKTAMNAGAVLIATGQPCLLDKPTVDVAMLRDASTASCADGLCLLRTMR